MKNLSSPVSPNSLPFTAEGAGYAVLFDLTLAVGGGVYINKTSVFTLGDLLGDAFSSANVASITGPAAGDFPIMEKQECSDLE